MCPPPSERPVTEPADHVVQRLYDAFRAGDGAAMQACYAPDATFRDEVFTLTGADRIGGMWRMLLERGGDLDVAVGDVRADATSGSARWEARYTFGATGRKVHNVIDASFVLRDDAIIDHVDRFGFWRWSRQALGPAGLALGWTPLIRGRVRRTATASLDRYLAGG